MMDYPTYSWVFNVMDSFIRAKVNSRIASPNFKGLTKCVLEAAVFTDYSITNISSTIYELTRSILTADLRLLLFYKLEF